MAKTKKNRKIKNKRKRSNKTRKHKRKSNKNKKSSPIFVDAQFGKRELVSLETMAAIHKVDGNNKITDFKDTSKIYNSVLNEFKRRLVIILAKSSKARKILNKKFKIKYNKNFNLKLDKLSPQKIEDIYFAIL